MKRTFFLEQFKEFSNHKLVVEIGDRGAGLKGFIAIHNDNLGLPAVGGTRMFPYRSKRDALIDVLNLSKAMTYKCAIAKVPHGGAKGVIIGNPKKDKTKRLLRAYAEQVNSLKGQFYTGEDVGLTQNDVNIMLRVSNYFIGKQDLAGDPSLFAALSTFYSIQSAALFVLKKRYLKGIKVAIKGVGKVGKELANLLDKNGVIVYASDIDETALSDIKRKVPRVIFVDNKEIHALPVEVYSPCALGGDFSMKIAPAIKAKIICGAANNQLADDKVGEWLFKHKILYVPDYVANAGGLMNVVDELNREGYNKGRVLRKISRIKEIVKEIIMLSRKEGRATNRIADEIAEKYFNN